ncbi:rho GTPase-activating protein 12b isoform X7 [Tachysurus fulvidraco]|uniref:rho GTPase-activating protein 12b isoform X7 n=1 Tax=Tachysurus fulvidraco TaxID=1234273 RepID=UPI001FEFD6B2|nr:rho GTPase-activating protein 12b isoform X7 [Tachysurus fulvidraco]
MSEMEGRSDSGLAPGQVYVEVEYDYEYKAKDRLISIHQGECYMLVRKTNSDWWQVRREDGTKAFYVPAQYVREVRRALLPPPKPRIKPPVTLPITHCSSASETLPQRTPSDMVSFGRPPPSSTPSPLPEQHTPPLLLRDSNQNAGMKDVLAELALLNNNNHHNHHHGNTVLLPRTRPESPSKEPPGCRGKPQGVSPSDTDGSSPGNSSEVLRNDSESGDELSSSSTEHTQAVSPIGHGRPESPVYTNLRELKVSQSVLPPVPSSSPLHVLGDWETHKDVSGRHFYYNKTTQERTWKPPRSRDTTGGSRGDTANTTDMEYSLPSPNTTDVPKSRSLERNQPDPIVLTKWRYSTFVDLSDKLSVKNRRFTLGHFSRGFGLSLYRYQESGTNKHNSPDSDSCPSSPKHSSTLSEKCGVLNVTKITENGKKVRKNWTSSWTVLQGSTLLFAKGQNSATSWSYYRNGSFPELLLSLLSNWKRSVKPRPAVSYKHFGPYSFGGNQSKPEFAVDLRGGSVEWASKEKSSKKHVIELKTRQGTELLIQSEIDSVIADWYRALTEVITTHAWESDEAIEEDMPESPGTEKQDKEKDFKKSKTLKSATMETADQKKTRVKLRKFLTRRPTLQAVRDKGYIKDQVFGCSITSLCSRENTSVPNFVRICIEHVEDTGLNVDGLYRVSGNLAVIQKLRFAVNHDEKVDLADSKWEDIHVVTGALKMFFRELPEPLFTYSSFNDFVNAIKNSDYKQRVQAIKDLIKQLPKPNQETMQVLFRHLKRVIEHGEANRMTTQSVAIVFGPTLLRPETETGNMAVHMVYQNQIVELILLEYDNIFGR